MAWSQLEPTSWEEDSTRIVPTCPSYTSKINDCLRDAERLLYVFLCVSLALPGPTTVFSSKSECKERVKQEYVEHINDQ